MAFLRQYEILIKKAKSDLKAGKNLLEDFTNGDDELDLETIMFHFQQCAETLLKSLLSFNKYHITKTHGIEDLLSTINNEKSKLQLMLTNLYHLLNMQLKDDMRLLMTI